MAEQSPEILDLQSNSEEILAQLCRMSPEAMTMIRRFAVELIEAFEVLDDFDNPEELRFEFDYQCNNCGYLGTD